MIRVVGMWFAIWLFIVIAAVVLLHFTKPAPPDPIPEKPRVANRGELIPTQFMPTRCVRDPSKEVKDHGRTRNN